MHLAEYLGFRCDFIWLCCLDIVSLLFGHTYDVTFVMVFMEFEKLDIRT